VHGHLTGNAPLQTKCNMLAFLEPVCAQDGIAGALVNTRLTPALLSLFEHASSSSLRERLASILGLLIRFAAQIDLSLISPGAHRASHLSKLVLEIC
jgi:hypothetical protein